MTDDQATVVNVHGDGGNPATVMKLVTNDNAARSVAPVPGTIVDMHDATAATLFAVALYRSSGKYPSMLPDGSLTASPIVP